MSANDEQHPKQAHQEEPSAKKQKCDGSGTLCCPLANDAKDFIIYVLKQHFEQSKKNRIRTSSTDDADVEDFNPLDYLSDRWLEDRDIASIALNTNSILATELPEVLQKDRAYLLQAVRTNSEVWHSLPEAFQADPEFIIGIPIFVDLLLLHDVFQRYPDYVNYRDIWVHALDTVTGAETGTEENREIFRKLLEDFAPDSIRSDKEIMKRCSTFIKHIFSYFGTLLRDDKEFFQSIYGDGGNNNNDKPRTNVTTAPAFKNEAEENMKYEI